VVTSFVAYHRTVSWTPDEENYTPYYQRRGQQLAATLALIVFAAGALVIVFLPSSSRSDRIGFGTIAGVLSVTAILGARFQPKGPIVRLSAHVLDLRRGGQFRWDEIAGVVRFRLMHNRMLGIVPRSQSDPTSSWKRWDRRLMRWLVGHPLSASIPLSALSKAGGTALDQSLAIHGIRTLDVPHRGVRRVVRFLVFAFFGA
jgi:hypothetical protein